MHCIFHVSRDKRDTLWRCLISENISSTWWFTKVNYLNYLKDCVDINNCIIVRLKHAHFIVIKALKRRHNYLYVSRTLRKRQYNLGNFLSGLKDLPETVALYMPIIDWRRVSLKIPEQVLRRKKETAFKYCNANQRSSLIQIIGAFLIRYWIYFKKLFHLNLLDFLRVPLNSATYISWIFLLDKDFEFAILKSRQHTPILFRWWIIIQFSCQFLL